MNLIPHDNTDRLLNSADLLLAAIASKKGSCSLLTLSLEDVIKRNGLGSTASTQNDLREARAFLFRLGFGRAADTAA